MIIESGAGVSKYLFNGIEKTKDFGLDWDMASFRSYGAAIGRWGQVDPLTELRPDMTSYRFGFNNPILYVDPFGLFEKKRHARRYRRKHKLKGKIIKGENGRYHIVNNPKSGGFVTKNTDGGIEYGAMGSRTGMAAAVHKTSKHEIKQFEPNLFEKAKDKGGFLGGVAYGITNDAWLVTQRMNPFDTHTTHLSGQYASREEYTLGLVNTAMTVIPLGRGSQAAKSVLPQGVTILQRLNAAQFSKFFKGTPFARMHPSTRGVINRVMNKGTDQINKRLENTSVITTPLKGLGKSHNKE